MSFRPVHVTASRFTNHLAGHGEGPLWDERIRRLLWVDMLAGRVLSTSLDGATSSITVPEQVAAGVRNRASGGHIVVGERTVWATDLQHASPAFSLLLDLDLPAGVRANEVGSTRTGYITVGTMAFDAKPGAGSVLVVRKDRANTVLTDVTIANGMWFPDEHTALFIDSAARNLRRFTVTEEGQWVQPSVVVDLTFGEASPDGMCVDTDGGYWIAFWDGGCVRRFDAQGRLTHVVAVPVPRPTSCAFIGERRNLLAITTSRLGVETTVNPEAGAVFAVEVDFQGSQPPLAV